MVELEFRAISAQNQEVDDNLFLEGRAKRTNRGALGQDLFDLRIRISEFGQIGLRGDIKPVDIG